MALGTEAEIGRYLHETPIGLLQKAFRLFRLPFLKERLQRDASFLAKAMGQGALAHEKSPGDGLDGHLLPEMVFQVSGNLRRQLCRPAVKGQGMDPGDIVLDHLHLKGKDGGRILRPFRLLDIEIAQLKRNVDVQPALDGGTAYQSRRDDEGVLVLPKIIFRQEPRPYGRKGFDQASKSGDIPFLDDTNKRLLDKEGIVGKRIFDGRTFRDPGIGKLFPVLRDQDVLERPFPSRQGIVDHEQDLKECLRRHADDRLHRRGEDIGILFFEAEKKALPSQLGETFRVVSRRSDDNDPFRKAQEGKIIKIFREINAGIFRLFLNFIRKQNIGIFFQKNIRRSLSLRQRGPGIRPTADASRSGRPEGAYR